MNLKISLVFLLLVSFLGAKGQYTIQDVPDNLPLQSKEIFLRRNNSLKEKWNNLEIKVQRHNTKCVGLTEGTSSYYECRKEEQELNTQMVKLKEDLKIYNTDLNNAKTK
jgi:hypothetical protein